MIKPNSITSHDWHVQPICQRSLRVVRLSGTLLDRGPGCYAKVSSNLLRSLDFCTLQQSSAFLREPSKVIEVLSPVKAYFQARHEGDFSVQKLRTAQNIKQRPAKNLPEPLGLTGDQLLGLAMACSL